MVESFYLSIMESIEAHSSIYAANHIKIESCSQISRFGANLNICHICLEKKKSWSMNNDKKQISWLKISVHCIVI